MQRKPTSLVTGVCHWVAKNCKPTAINHNRFTPNQVKQDTTVLPSTTIDNNLSVAKYWAICRIQVMWCVQYVACYNRRLSLCTMHGIRILARALVQVIMEVVERKALNVKQRPSKSRIKNCILCLLYDQYLWQRDPPQPFKDIEFSGCYSNLTPPVFSFVQ
jgi:hypothetical protein